MFRNIDEIMDTPLFNSFYINLVKNFLKTSDVFLFALCLSETLVVPAIIMQNALFSTAITVDFPVLATREKLFEASIKKRKIILDENVSINRLAKDAFGETPLSIDYIVKEAYLYSLRQGHETVTQSDFSETIMKISSGEKIFKMTEKERIFTAYHEAGHVVAGYFSNPDYILNRVEISPRGHSSLGLTVNDHDESKHTYFRTDFENNIICFLGGLAAEVTIYGKHSSGVSADLALATAYAANIVNTFGMHEEFGPMVVIPEVTNSNETKALSEKLIRKMLDDLLIKTKALILAKRPYLDALAEALLKKEVVMGSEIKEIFEKVAADIGDTEFISAHPSSKE